MRHEHEWTLVWQGVSDVLPIGAKSITVKRLEVYRCECGEMGYPA